MLREMELVGEDGQYVYVDEMETEMGELNRDGYSEDFPPLVNAAPVAEDGDKWCPVQATRHSTRHQITGQTMLQIAQALREVVNLEKPKKPSGVVEHSENGQVLDGSFPGSNSAEAGELLLLPFRFPEEASTDLSRLNLNQK